MIRITMNVVDGMVGLLEATKQLNKSKIIIDKYIKNCETIESFFNTKQRPVATNEYRKTPK